MVRSGDTKPEVTIIDPTRRYTCPAHPDVDVPMPGKCPRCGTELVLNPIPGPPPL